MTLFCKVGVDGFVASVVLGVGNYFLSLLAPLFVDKVCMGCIGINCMDICVSIHIHVPIYL